MISFSYLLCTFIVVVSHDDCDSLIAVIAAV